MKSELVFPAGTGGTAEGVPYTFQSRTRLIRRKNTLRLYRNTVILDRRSFLMLYASFGAWIETEAPKIICEILGLPEGDPRVKPWGSPEGSPKEASLRLIQ
jgi:hypothetical protein